MTTAGGSSGNNNFDRTNSLRHLALQIAAQLPSDPTEARQILDVARLIVERIYNRGGELEVLAEEHRLSNQDVIARLHANA